MLLLMSFIHYLQTTCLYIVAVDDTDVTGLNVSQITAIMAKRSDQERRLTVITSSKARSRAAKIAPQGSTTASESETTS